MLASLYIHTMYSLHMALPYGINTLDIIVRVVQKVFGVN